MKEELAGVLCATEDGKTRRRCTQRWDQNQNKKKAGIMRNWKLAKKIIKEMQRRTSPWRDLIETCQAMGQGKILLTIILAILGIICSLKSNDWMWFARSGCLISILAIMMVVSNLKTELDGKSKVNRLGEIDSKATDELKADVIIFCKNVDLFVLIIGNLIWGFGDLVGKVLTRS